MTEQTKVMRRGGLDWTVPNDGKAADAYAVACTVQVLVLSAKKLGYAKAGANDVGTLAPARHATRLHVISGLLHRLSERQCNEDLGCRECDGTGERNPGLTGAAPCPYCAGTGSTVGRREKSLEADAQEIASHYGLTCYFQGDPRGASLYLIDPTMVPKGEEESRWIDVNYNRGHSVVRLGR